MKPTISLYVHNNIMLVHYISTAHVWPMTIITIPFSILIIITPAFRLGLADDKHTSHIRTCTHYCVLSYTIIQNAHSNISYDCSCLYFAHVYVTYTVTPTKAYFIAHERTYLGLGHHEMMSQAPQYHPWVFIHTYIHTCSFA